MMDIVMPRLTDSMEEGTILAWLKQDGDSVAIGDELVEIETDKASMVYEADAEGVLKILVGEDETRPIGETIATVGEGSSETPSQNGKVPDEEASVEEPEVADKPAPETVPEPDSGNDVRVKASPLAKRIAADEGIDLKSVHGSGPNGRIVKADLTKTATRTEPVTAASAEAGAAAAKAGPSEAKKGEVETVELTRLQQLISRRMSESKATAPHFYLRTEIDMTRAVEVRTAFKEAAAKGESVPSFNDMVVKATAMALRHHPRANGTYRDGRVELYSRINVGFAVAADDSLVVPTIGDADQKDLREIAVESRRLAERVRSGEITPPELAGGTFSISNLGMFGVRGFDAVINPGQAGILAIGEIAERPVVRGGKIVPAHLMEISLSCDHRILYGADGAEFLAEIKSNLEEPGLLA
ncbi:MAG: 2-oxo acid dehydrogenase subunit E2 [Thermoleophilia bacterium]|nr:2-oxo acid dehydrogenase subunit E2 [Thermoleophilia bacterium]